MASICNQVLTISLIVLGGVLGLSRAQYFSIEPQNRETIAGNRVVMTCRVFRRPEGAQVYWQIPAVGDRFIGPEYTVPAPYSDRFLIVGNSQLDDYDLVINSATAADDGSYQCILFSPSRGDTPASKVSESKEATLKVATLSPTGAPACWASPQRNVHIGDNVRLHCASSTVNLDVQWTLGSETLPSTTNSSTAASTLITTTFVANVDQNEARFVCATDNQQCQIVLGVTSPPVVTITPIGEVKVGGDGRFQCMATGNPNVFVYFWKYQEEPIEYTYDRRFNMATLEENNEILVLPDMHMDDDAKLLECTAINEHGQGVATFPIRVANNNISSIVAWSLCAVIVAIILLLLLGFFYWRSRQRKKMEKISESHKGNRPVSPGPIEIEMNGHVNPAFTSFSALEVDSVGYGPDVQPYQSRPSDREYDHGEPKPIPRQNSESRSRGGESDSDYIARDVDDDEVTQTYTYQVNPKFEEYRNKASYDVSNVVDEDDDDRALMEKESLPQNNLDIEKELVGELSMFSDNYDKNFDESDEPVIVSTEL